MFKRTCAVNKFVLIDRFVYSSAIYFLRFILYGSALLIAETVFPEQIQAAETLVVNITVNSVSKGDFFVIRNETGEFFVRAEDFPSIGLQLPVGPGTVMEGKRYISLSTLSGVSVVFDEKRLSIVITASACLLPKNVLDLASPPPSRQNVYYPKDKSAFLNYGVNYSFGDPFGFQSFTIADKLGMRSGNFFFLTDSQYTRTDQSADFVRLMSSLTYERPTDLQWITAGDMFASSGSLGSTINIGGLGISKIYQMDPYLIKQPTLNLIGAVTLPSQVDIYMDGALVGRQNVQPGQFELQNLNYYGGARNVELVIKDPFGNEQRLRYPAYFTDALLKKGLHDYSYNIGFLREQYGTESNDYSKPAFSAFHRYGVSDSWTVGASAEASGDIYNGSIQTSFLIPRAGVATAALAESAGASDVKGTAASLSHSYQKDGFGSSLLLTTYTHDYTTIGSSSFAEKIKYVESITLSYTTINRGAFSVGYSQEGVYDSDTRRVPSVNYTYNLTRALTLSVTTQAVMNSGTDYQAFVSLNYYPAKDIQVTAQVQSTRDGNTETLQWQKNTPTGEGLGYHAFFTRNESSASGTTNLFNPYIQYNGRYGTYSLDSYFQQIGGTNSQTYNVNAAGALVYASGFFGFTRPVNDSFSMVMADTLPDVDVMVNNEEIGKTDSSGRMIVPTMRSYNMNQITLVGNNIPIEYTLSGMDANVVPPMWSGSCVAFEVAKIQAVTGMISVKQNGNLLPLEFYDVVMIVNGKEFKFPTGRNGEFYFETVMKEKDGNPSAEQRGCRALKEKTRAPNKIAIPGIYQASFEYEGRTCPFTIAIPPSDDVMIDMGKIVCEMK